MVHVLFTLIRHAHAGEKQLWRFADADRPLSLQGRQQAQGVTEALAGTPVRLLLSSPYRRCRQTLAPLATRTGLQVQATGLLAPDAKPAALDAFLQNPALDGAVLCTHGETLQALLRRWRRRGGVDLPPLPGKISKDATAKGAGWLIEDSAGTLTAHYLRPVRVLDLTTAPTHARAS